jgi:hypothetical protein
MSDIIPPEEVRAFTLHMVNAGYSCIRMWPQIGAYTGIRPSNGEWELFWGIIGDEKPGGLWVYPDHTRARAALRAWNTLQGGAPVGWIRQKHQR